MVTPNAELNDSHIQRLRFMAEHLYQGSYRTYHNWQHILSVLGHARLLTGRRINKVQLLAILFHDAIYIPSCLDNEALSSLLMNTLMMREDNRDLPFSFDELKRASEAILATKHHFSEAQFSPEINVVMDADLSSLACTDYLDFLTVQTNVLKEYSHIDLGTRVKGQKTMLRKLLDRPSVFRSDPAIYPIVSQWELRARANLSLYCNV